MSTVIDNPDQKMSDIGETVFNPPTPHSVEIELEPTGGTRVRIRVEGRDRLVVLEDAVHALREFT
jgi:hypothetical protein